MKNIVNLIISGNFRDLMFSATNDTWIQIFRSLFVGGIAFVVDATVLFVFEKLGLHYLVSAAIAFVFGLVTNFLLSKYLVFSAATTKVNKTVEFLTFAVIGVIGLLLTEIMMYFFTDYLEIYFMLSKVIAAIIVLFWNFGSRKIILYRS